MKKKRKPKVGEPTSCMMCSDETMWDSFEIKSGFGLCMCGSCYRVIQMQISPERNIFDFWENHADEKTTFYVPMILEALK